MIELLPARHLVRGAGAIIGLALLLSGCVTGAGNVVPAAMKATSSDNAPANPESGTDAARALPVAPVVLTALAEAELLPDRQCNRPRERFNIAEKLVAWGGTAAQAHLERILATDFRTYQLSPLEQKLLKLVAYGTVWVPVQVEAALVQSAARFAPRRDAPEMYGDVITKLDQRLTLFQLQVPDFPERIRVVAIDDIADGAYAQMGASIEVTTSFLNTLSSSAPTARDFVLAHELSHVYKRHRIKQLQLQLLSSPVGWKIARRLLDMAMTGADSANLWQMVQTAMLVPDIVEFVKAANLKFAQEQELEADACTAVWLRAARVDTCAAWKGFAAIAPKTGNYADTHPTTQRRGENFMKKIAGLPCDADIRTAPLPKVVKPKVQPPKVIPPSVTPPVKAGT